jgi:hypothetical protein
MSHTDRSTARRTARRTVLLSLAAALVPLAPLAFAPAALAAPLGAAAPAAAIKAPAAARVVPVRSCRRRMGPYATQRRAWALVRLFRARGYRTSGVWGSGGVYYGTRGYYFNVFYRC